MHKIKHTYCIQIREVFTVYVDVYHSHIIGKSSGSELWEEYFNSLLHLVKDYVVNIWEVRKIKIYGDDSSQSQYYIFPDYSACAHYLLL